MTREQHDKFIQEIEQLQAEVGEARFEDFELTAEEQDVIDSMPEKYSALVEELLASYTPANASYDFRQAAVNKMLARFFIEVVPKIRGAYEMGVKTA